MALKATNQGELEMLARIVMKSSPGAGDTLMLRLYDNDITPAEGDTFLTMSESDGAGYEAIPMTAASWTISTGGGDTTSATYAQQTFTYSGGDTLYGYYFTTKTEGGDTILYWSERFSDGPYTIPGGGGTVKITPRIQLD